MLDCGPRQCEILPAGVNKGSGMKRLLEHLGGVPTEAVLACGDAENDVEMLRAAGVGVAMGNAKPIAMEAEGGMPELDLPFRTLAWAEGWKDDDGPNIHGNSMPDVDKAKWLSFGKAMTTWCARWTGDPNNQEKSKIPQLQVAYFNGLGYETWENVWGTWNGVIERDGAAVHARDALGNCPLHVACVHAQVTAVQLCLSHTAPDEKNHAGCTALALAASASPTFFLLHLL